MKTEELDNIFTYHSPTSSQIPRYSAIRQKAKELAVLINESTPASRE